MNNLARITTGASQPSGSNSCARTPSKDWDSWNCQGRWAPWSRSSGGMPCSRAASFAAHFFSGKPPTLQMSMSSSRLLRAFVSVEAPEVTSSTYVSSSSVIAPSGNRALSSLASCFSVRMARNGAHAWLSPSR
ncbi:uncharacterized protein [Temnothorax nylanderi]|uniref:uncharacterized protein n=1 Tax=Temnothorax nylanderi TaxID=102681 RepID=UPI003A83DA3F